MSEHGPVTEGAGRVPMAFGLGAADRPGIEQLLPLVDQVPAVRGKAGRPRRRFDVVQTDRGFDPDANCDGVRERASEPLIPGRRPPHGRLRRAQPSRGLGRYRWVIERVESWPH